jgi:hypothetical protein
MGQNYEEKKQNSPIEQRHQPSMGQNGSKIKENCPIERLYGTKLRGK